MLQGRQAETAAVLDDELEAAGDAEARDRRRAVHGDLGLLDLRGPFAAQLGHDGRVAQLPGSRRSSKGSSTMNIEAKLGLLACRINDSPEMATVCATPGVFRAIRSTCCHGFLGPLQRRRVGQLDVDDQPALVLLRDEAGGRTLKHPVGQDEQAAVDDQHDDMLRRRILPTVQP